VACKSLVLAIPKYSLGVLWGTGWTWNDLWKNRPSKQEPEVQ